MWPTLRILHDVVARFLSNFWLWRSLKKQKTFYANNEKFFNINEKREHFEVFPAELLTTATKNFPRNWFFTTHFGAWHNEFCCPLQHFRGQSWSRLQTIAVYDLKMLDRIISHSTIPQKWSFLYGVEEETLSLDYVSLITKVFTETCLRFFFIYFIKTCSSFNVKLSAWNASLNYLTLVLKTLNFFPVNLIFMAVNNSMKWMLLVVKHNLWNC